MYCHVIGFPFAMHLETKIKPKMDTLTFILMTDICSKVDQVGYICNQGRGSVQRQEEN